jgi:DHA1 family tetracycline resistance protein-like MFS transporter
VGLSGLAQFTLHMTWVLYTDLKFGWGPRETGWSLFAVGVMSALVQGVMMGPMLRRFSPRRLAVLGLISSTLAFAAWGAATQGWMMYVVIVLNVLGFAAATAIQSIISNAADAKIQGQTMGAVAGLNSLMAVIAPIVGPALLTFVSHFPRGDWRIGAPYYFCAALQAVSTVMAVHHFRRTRLSAAPIRP